MKCPCGTGSLYMACCGRFIDGGDLPPTAEELMRSRYTAFVRRCWSYVSKTQTERFTGHDDDALNWTQLVVHSSESGGENDSEGWVTFTASFEQSGDVQEMTEKSYFVKKSKQWLYEPSKSLTGIPKALVIS